MRVTHRPTLRLDLARDGANPTGVRVDHVGPDLIAACQAHPGADDLLRSVLRVSVVPPASLPPDDGLPDVAGRYEVLADAIRFVPRLPFAPGVKYRVRFEGRAPGGAGCPVEGLEAEFLCPGADGGGPPEVTDVFPSGDRLPENLLRFYVRFSGSMRRGQVEEQVALLGPDGLPAPDVLYRPPTELWDRTMRHLTILLDPGRLKRGVGPNAALGPPLKAGAQYTLVIGAGMVDAAGRALRRSFAKRFRVTAAVREAVAVEQWRLARPRAGSEEPLVLRFPRALDRAMLGRAVRVETAGGQTLDGKVAIDHHERGWRFTPTRPWVAENYRVRVGSGLEDVCGNSVVAAFDRPLRTDIRPDAEAADRFLAFHPR